MNGPQHYNEAQLLAEASAHHLNLGRVAEARACAELATAHATLALAAATAMQAAVDGSEPGMGSGEYHAWCEAAGVKPPQRTAGPSPTLLPSPASFALLGCTCDPDAVLPCSHCPNCDRCEDCGQCTGTGCTCKCEAAS